MRKNMLLFMPLLICLLLFAACNTAPDADNEQTGYNSQAITLGEKLAELGADGRSDANYLDLDSRDYLIFWQRQILDEMSYTEYGIIVFDEDGQHGVPLQKIVFSSAEDAEAYLSAHDHSDHEGSEHIYSDNAFYIESGEAGNKADVISTLLPHLLVSDYIVFFSQEVAEAE